MSLRGSIIRQLVIAPATLADLQLVSHVSLPTLRKAIQELIDSRWIRIVGQAETNGGRPAMLFGIDDGYYQIVGIHLQLPGVRLITTSLTGEIVDESYIFRDIVPTPGQVAQAASDYVARIRAEHPDRLILGIGIATPGFTDPSTGDILSIGRVSGWHNFPICRRLHDSTGVPVYIANDIDCMALAEFRHTHQPLDRNLAYVGFDEGVKVSLFIRGELYQSSLGNAGLISGDLLHVRDIDDRDEMKSLLTIIGVNRLFEQRLLALDTADRQPYSAILAAGGQRERFRLIFNGAVAGLPVCHDIVQALIRSLAAAIADVIYFVQPDITVIGGMLSLMPDELFAELELAIGRYLPSLIHNNAILRPARLSSSNSAAMGAIQHFLKNYPLEDTP